MIRLLPLLLLSCAGPEPIPAETDDTDLPVVLVPDAFNELGLQAGLLDSQFDMPESWPRRCGSPMAHGGGAAVGDYDNDGHQDVFLGVYEAQSRLYRGRGDGTFEDATTPSGIDLPDGEPSGGVWADIEGDGDLDLLVGYVDRGWLSLWVNQGDGTFTDETATRGFAPPTPDHVGCPFIWSLAFGDPDLDGDLDLLMGSWHQTVGEFPQTLSTYFENDGTGHFVDATEAAGLRLDHTMLFTPLWGDLTGDGWPDLAAVGDFGTTQLHVNDGAGSFTLADSEQAGVDDLDNGMGGTLVDLDEDGALDWLATAIFDARGDVSEQWGHTGNRAWINQGDGTFVDVSADLGVRDSGWGWGIAAFDVDNDRDLDLAATNGHTLRGAGGDLMAPFREDPTRLWIRASGRPPFTDQAAALNLVHTGQGRGVVPVDFDEDGDQDVLLVQFADRPLLYRNDLERDHHWLRVAVRSEGPNTHGIGATVEVTASSGGAVQHRLITASPTYLSQGPAVAHFGLGTHEGPLHRVVVRWPYGEDRVLSDVAVDQTLTIEVP